MSPMKIAARMTIDMPVDLYEQLEQHAQETGQYKTRIIRDSLILYFSDYATNQAKS